jgi:hypothetical protein
MNNIFESLINKNDLDKATVVTNDVGQSVLHFVCENGREECLIKILDILQNKLPPKDLKQYINKQDINGNTALHIATNKQDNIIAGLLELYGADKNKVNNNNEIITSSSEHNEIIKCGEEKKIKKLISQLTRASTSTSSSFSSDNSVANLDDIVLSDKDSDKGNVVTNFFKGMMTEQVGGAENTDELIERIKVKLEMTGGAKKAVAKKSATKTSATKTSATKKSATKTSAIKKSPTKKSATKTSVKDYTSSEIHEQVVTMIQDLGYSLEEAKVIKAGLYRYTKSEHPELNSYDRALQMKKYTTEQHIANIDIMAVRQAIEIHYQQKNKK